ncbi:hypothetical protein [Paenibacillus sp. N3.4]|uniref:hypothetical protein n=1 Tax=Paenibacillus sp. N3.4 TaxID=2603222 RepID=UPI0011CC90DE|nr:hypothetical protein [Paenibacillus sp. N3.4]TXK85622.1 hypothetical protein FU659_03485 [Paenibacillus sp. N3.4]
MVVNSMKKAGSIFLFTMSFLAFMMTWEVKLLSPLGGIFIVGISFGGAILMWLDFNESLQRAVNQHAKRAEIDH